jgi:OmpA-OmpF porin, OOP family
MKLWIRMLLSTAILFFAANLRAQDDDKPKDAEGCKDSPLITRFPGSIIHSCENKEYEQADFPLGADKDGNERTKHVEGEYHSSDIGTREGTSEIQVFRNFQTALKTAGFAIDYANSPEQIVAHKGSTWIFIDNRGEFYYQTIVTEKVMKQEVTADASTLSDEISRSGHVGLRNSL